MFSLLQTTHTLLIFLRQSLFLTLYVSPVPTRTSSTFQFTDLELISPLCSIATVAVSATNIPCSLISFCKIETFAMLPLGDESSDPHPIKENMTANTTVSFFS